MCINILILNVNNTKLKCLILANTSRKVFVSRKKYNFINMDITSKTTLDVIFILGNLVIYSNIRKLIRFLSYILRIKSKYYILVPGSEDNYFAINNEKYINHPNYEIYRHNNIINKINDDIYIILKNLTSKFIILIDDYIEITINNNTIKIYGQSYAPSDKIIHSDIEKYHNGYSYLIPRDSEMLKKKRNNIKKCDILLTSFPPYKVLDLMNNTNIGCNILKQKIIELKPRYNLFYSPCLEKKDSHNETTFINANILAYLK